MGLKQVEPTIEKINGVKFYITPFPAFKAANITGELASVLVPLLGALMPLVNDDTDLMDVKVSDAADAIAGVNIDGDKMEALIRKLILGGHIVVEVEDDKGKVEPERLDSDMADEIFCGNVQDMFILCFYVIRLNFNGFFKTLGSQFGTAGSSEKKTRKVV